MCCLSMGRKEHTHESTGLVQLLEFFLVLVINAYAVTIHKTRPRSSFILHVRCTLYVRVPGTLCGVAILVANSRDVAIGDWWKVETYTKKKSSRVTVSRFFVLKDTHVPYLL